MFIILLLFQPFYLMLCKILKHLLLVYEILIGAADSLLYSTRRCNGWPSFHTSCNKLSAVTLFLHGRNRHHLTTLRAVTGGKEAWINGIYCCVGVG